MRVLLVFALIHVVGYLVLRILAGQRSSLLPIELWGMSFGAGSGVFSLGLFYLAFWGLPLDFINVCILAASLLGGSLLLWFVLEVRRGAHQGSSAVAHPCDHGVSVHSPMSIVEWASVAITSLCIVIVFADAVSQPLVAFDARAIWAFKAKVLYFEEGIYNEAFLDAERLHAKTRYPQLIPLTQALIASLSGGFDERVIKVMFPCFYVSLILLVGWESGRELGRRYGLAATGLFASLPAFTIYANGGAASGYADLPLAFYVTALATRLLHWLQTGSASDLRLVALFTSLTLFTKTEGLALVFVVFFATAMAAWLVYERTLGRLWPLPSTALGGMLFLTPWFLYQRQLPIVDEDFMKLLTIGNLLTGFDRLPYILGSFVKEFFLKPHLWNVLGFSAVFVFLRSPASAIHSRFGILLWSALLYLVLLCAIFLVIPWELEELLPVALSRLVMHIAPLLFLWICFELGNFRAENRFHLGLLTKRRSY